MRATDRFIARVDAKAPEALTQRELRTRLGLLEAELQQLDHDQRHVNSECIGSEKSFHLRKIEEERSKALELQNQLLAVLGDRS